MNSTKAGYPALASVPMANEPGEWREVVTEAVAPPDSTSIMLRLYIDKQEADAKCWIDDVFIGEMPP